VTDEAHEGLAVPQFKAVSIGVVDQLQRRSSGHQNSFGRACPTRDATRRVTLGRHNSILVHTGVRFEARAERTTSRVVDRRTCPDHAGVGRSGTTMGTALSTDGATATPIGVVTCGPIHSSSKAHLEVPGDTGDDQRVPVRRIALTTGTTFDVYDTSGPYTGYPDPADCHDLASGLPPTRRGWSHPEAVSASADNPTLVRTQLAWARAGLTTPEMRFIAVREGIDVEVVRSEVAAG